MSTHAPETPPSGTDIFWQEPLRRAFHEYWRHASQSGQEFVMTFEEVPASWSKRDQEKVRQWQCASRVLWQAMAQQMAITLMLGAPFDAVDTLMVEELRLRDSDDGDTAARLRLYQDVLRTQSTIAAGRRGKPAEMIEQTRNEAGTVVGAQERKPWQRPFKERA